MKFLVPAASAALLLISAVPSMLHGESWPYQMYEEYYEGASRPPLPAQAREPSPQTQPHLRKEQVQKQVSPTFLFPPELGFGVAVGVSYDMFYLSGSYFTVEEGRWSRGATFRGPWSPISSGRLPPQLLKYDVATMRRMRNDEFKAYSADRAGYRGKVFRPGAGEKVRRPQPKNPKEGLP